MRSFNLVNLSKILDEKKSGYNGIVKVVKTLGSGIYIQSNGLTQSGGIVEVIWRQTLRKVKSGKLKVKSCLILGLGGGTAAKLVNKYWPSAKITGVDIDPLMIDLGKKYLGLNGASIDIKVGDALKQIKVIKGKFDLIILDLYQGDKFPEKFNSNEFIKLVKSHIAGGGLAIFNQLYYGDKRSEAVKFGRRLENIFSKVEWFYPEANLMLICSI